MNPSSIEKIVKKDENTGNLCNILKNIKSNYILGKIFSILIEKKKLEIAQYNNTLKSRIKINIKDYKIYSETIEIEIKPINNIDNKIINIKEDEQKYCHIFFNDNKNEIKRYNINENENIKIIKVLIEPQIKSFKDLFYECKCIESIIFKNFSEIILLIWNICFMDVHQ